MPSTLICERCKLPFQHLRRNKKKCAACSLCLICGKPTKEGRTNYCSHRCGANQRKGQRVTQRPRATTNCRTCQKLIVQRHRKHLYCSLRCSGLATYPRVATKMRAAPRRSREERSDAARARQGRRGLPRPNMRGPNCPLWRGGTSEARSLEYNRNAHRQWRKAVFERDDYTCQRCGQRGGHLNAHHKKPWADYPELRTDIDNGETLCLVCHANATNDEIRERMRQRDQATPR